MACDPMEPDKEHMDTGNKAEMGDKIGSAGLWQSRSGKFGISRAQQSVDGLSFR
jgi:hypothetical protein